MDVFDNDNVVYPQMASSLGKILISGLLGCHNTIIFRHPIHQFLPNPDPKLIGSRYSSVNFDHACRMEQDLEIER